MERKVLWTSTDVAEALSVGVSSVKRWTEEGRLESTKTIGGHRRYDPEAIRRFADAKGLPTDKLPPSEPPPAASIADLSADEIRLELLRVLKQGDGSEARKLIAYPIATIADRTAFLDRVLGEALRLIGDGWSEGTWSVEEEHRASYIVSEVLDGMRPPGERRIRRAVLAAPPGELHDLPLRMVRLVLEWSGWATEYYGADVPWTGLEYTVVRQRPDLLALTARTAEPFDEEEFENIVRECRIRGTRIALGGEWARGGVHHRETGYTRFRTLRGFEAWIRGFDRILGTQ